MSNGLELQNGLFEYLNIADAERIHSQVIVWLLSRDAPLSSAEKSKFLTSFLGLKDKAYRTIDAITEFQSIDILIRADDDLFVIENKLKSSQHSDQLEKYKKILKHSFGFWITEGARDREFYFLTLIGEEADSEDWINIGYGQLLKAVQQIDHVESYPLISAYLTSLENLMGVVNSFNENHRNFKRVFTEGSLTKWKKAQSIKDGGGHTPAEAYIAKCQLETILQKMFMARLAGKLSLDAEDAIEINETRGTGLLQVRFMALSFSMDGNLFHMGVQLQGRSFKINMMADEYSSSKKGLILAAHNEFKAVAKENGCRFNDSRSKAYLSMSKRLKELYDYSFDELVECIDGECAKARLVCVNLRYRIESLHNSQLDNLSDSVEPIGSSSTYKNARAKDR